MGIRVHKMIGYGLTDLKYDEDKLLLTDERINPEGYLGSNHNPKWEDLDYHIKPYTKYLESLLPEDENYDVKLELGWLQNTEYTKELPLYDYINSQLEYGLPNVLCVQPVICDKWVQYDLSVDFHEEIRLHEQQNRVVTYNSGFYPYDLYVDKRDQRLLNPAICNMFNMISRRMAFEADAEVIKSAERLAESLGFESIGYAMENIVPQVPDGVKRICRYAELFTSEEVLNTLKPMLYVYWA